jgi:cytochrome c-type protein NapB
MDDNAPSPGHHTTEDLFTVRLRRFVPLLAVIGITLAVVGYVTGTRDPAAAIRPSTDGPTASHDVPHAVSYSELPDAKLRPDKSDRSLAELRYDRPGIFDPVVRTEEMKLAALADRAKNRAYDGAPPTVPHPVDAQSVASCLACHGEGLKVADRLASRISHAHLSNCTQCHVEQSRAPVENSFVGVFRAGPGERASPGAPPTIPHHTWMRENCSSCHGLVTRPGTRTTHPWLTNCTQCHAPSAIRDQVNFLGARP